MLTLSLLLDSHCPYNTPERLVLESVYTGLNYVGLWGFNSAHVFL